MTPAKPPLREPVAALPFFDPRRVPVHRVDQDLPAVDSRRLLPEALQSRFDLPPSWAPEVTAERAFSQRTPTRAAVLIPLVARARPTVLLTLRTDHLSTHSGQIAFPGGKQDDVDADANATALREAHEEVGLAPHHVHVLGSLPTYITGSSFVITPVVALVAPEHTLQCNAGEVAAVFEVPLDFLMNPAHHRLHRLEWEGVVREWFSMPYQDGSDERFIWGATAGMLRNLYRFLSA